MLNESSRYDYVEVRESIPDALAHFARRARKSPRRITTGHLVLPCGSHMLQTVASFPMQSYLQQRFPHFGGKSVAARALRAENQRRHDIAALRGNWHMTRTS